MKGHHVIRRFGWDTHGVPIEQIIDRQLQEELGVRGKKAVEEIGIAAYNERCRKVVLTYAAEWERVISRLARWVSFKDDYKTMDATFMESGWWVMKQLFDKGMVYRGAKVLPYSTALNTPLSKSEAQEDYRDVQDPAVVIAFPLREDENTCFLAWTTTPWTLPSNIALCAHPDFDYVKIKDTESGRNYILMEAGLKQLYKDPKKALKEGKYEIVEKGFKGKSLKGKQYLPPFDYFFEENKDIWFQMLNDTYVQSDEGVGIVHQSPSFGEDDYNISLREGLIDEKRRPPKPVDESGCFVLPVQEFEGQHVKSADKNIMKHLEEKGRLVRRGQIFHRYPFCPRSKTPLIQMAVDSWFVRVEPIVPQLLENLEKTHWVPTHVKEARFRNWLASAKDWNISRNRYWGLPIPLWVSDDMKEVVCIGSIEELRELSGYTGEINDLHRDKIDHITIPSKQGKGDLHRIDEVFDCWFESGSMPYASSHFPFEGKDTFHDKFPGDFIAEGLDQTRGWFYTLSVLGTHLFGTFPYKNCVVNGIVLAEDGKKMSKSLKNFPDPTLVLDKYGADPLRLYLINSPVVRAEPLRFSEQGVKQVVSQVILPLWNSYNMFSQQVTLLKVNQDIDFMYDPKLEATNTNVMDKWILASCQSLLKYVNEEMAAYRLYTVVPRLLGLIEDTTNWYIRFNRRRLKGEFGKDDTLHALNTLFEVIYTLVRGLAPFTPYITDNIYQRISKHIPKELHGEDMRSVHFLPYPEVREELFDEVVERRVQRMQEVINLGRLARERRTVSLKTPLKSLVVVHTDEQYLDDVRSLESYVIDELNIRDLILTSDEEKYGVEYSVIPDVKSLGQKFKKDAMKVKKALPNLSAEEIRTFMQTGSLTVEGCALAADDLRVKRGITQTEENKNLEVAVEAGCLVILDSFAYPELAQEGLAREFLNRVQRLRKKAGVLPTESILAQYRVIKDEGGDLDKMVEAQRELLDMKLRGGVEKEAEANGVAAEGKGKVLLEEEAEIKDVTVLLRLVQL